MEVVEVFDEDPEVAAMQISVLDPKVAENSLAVGDFLREQLPPIDLGRVAAQTAKQVILQKVRDAERERQYEDFKDRVSEIVNGTVKRVEFGDVIVDLGRAEAVIRRNKVIKGEMFKVNDRVRAYVEDVRREAKGPQIFLSRTAPEFMVKLFAQEVPEIYDGIIEVKAAAREPGSRAKIAVFSRDSSIDPVGSCVGVRGSRVQAVINEMFGEKIDIIQWSSDVGTFLVSALAPADVAKVVIDEDRKRIEVVVPEDQLSLAIGRRGQNVRLASQLVGWNIDVMTEDEESKRRTEEFNSLSSLFIEALNVEDVIAHLLVTEGFNSVEEIAYVALSEIASVEGFDEDIAAELQSRAREYLEQKKKDAQENLSTLGAADDFVALEGLSDEIKVSLVEKGIKKLDDFADLSREEFAEMVPHSGLTNDTIDALIMKARAHWFDGEGDVSVASEEQSKPVKKKAK
jgi:N utilization substance protein A